MDGKFKQNGMVSILQVGASNEIWAVGIDEMEKWNIKNLDQEKWLI